MHSVAWLPNYRLEQIICVALEVGVRGLDHWIGTVIDSIRVHWGESNSTSCTPNLQLHVHTKYTPCISSHADTWNLPCIMSSSCSSDAGSFDASDAVYREIVQVSQIHASL